MVNTENRKQVLSPMAIIDYIKKKKMDKIVLLVNPNTTMRTGWSQEKWWLYIPQAFKQPQ
jgi:hypothetical protein